MMTRKSPKGKSELNDHVSIKLEPQHQTPFPLQFKSSMAFDLSSLRIFVKFTSSLEAKMVCMHCHMIIRFSHPSTFTNKNLNSRTEQCRGGGGQGGLNFPLHVPCTPGSFPLP